MLGQPSVIARLMGMEFEAPTIVSAPAAAAAAAVIREEDTVDLLKPPSKHKPFKCTSLPHHGRINGDYYRYCLNKMKPRRRSRRSSSTSSSSRGHRHDRHPQEELLEKIKEDFRASWHQASMATEPATEGGGESAVASASGRRSGDRAGVLGERLNIQRIAQENLRREKMARYGHGAAAKIKAEDEDDDIALKKAEETEQQRGGSESMVAVSEQDSEEFSGAFNGEPEHHGRSTSTPTLIAILRPVGTAGGGTGADDTGVPALGTPPPSWKALRDGRGMDDFLRAVKERLDNEMKDKTGNGHLAPPTTTTRRKGWGSDEAKGDTARRIREAAGMAKEDLGRRLSRLESFRVFRGDRGRRDAAAVKSPEHRMLKSVRARIEAMSPKKTGKQGLLGSSSPVSSRGTRVWRSPLADASLLSGVGSDEEEEWGQSCCRGDQQRAMTRLWKVHGATPTADTGVGLSPSPRALVRSFSAPASSAIFSGGPETASLSRSRSFSLLRTTVSSGLKQSFSLGGKLLLLMHMSKKKPPSSSSSSPSPVSPLEVQGRGARHFAGDLSCTFLPESSPKRSPKCSSEFEASVIGGESPWRWKNEAAAARADDPDKAYVRELLIAAGLFDDDSAGSSEDTAAATTLSYDVFYEVEDAYYYRCLRRRVYGDSAGEEEDDGSPDRRRLLFDLANEALTVMQAGPSSSSPSLRRWVVESASSSRLRSWGSELEDHVWRRVARAMAEDDDDPVPTVDGMVEGEVGGSPWMALREDVCAVGRKVERAIFDDLVSEVMRQVFVRT